MDRFCVKIKILMNIESKNSEYIIMLNENKNFDLCPTIFKHLTFSLSFLNLLEIFCVDSICA